MKQEMELRKKAQVGVQHQERQGGFGVEGKRSE